MSTTVKERQYQLGLLGSGGTLAELVAASLRTLRHYLDESADKYELCFSGGKDSITIKRLADMAGVPYEARYRVTTIDPPPLVRFIREHHPDVIWDHPKVPFFALMPRRGIPMRKGRWCCQEYKETKTTGGRVGILGVRAAESPRRAANWTVFSKHGPGNKPSLAPILHWPDDAVWEFIRSEQLPYCNLYDQGFKRLGCVGCPMAREAGRKMEFARWPRYERLWRQAFDRLWERKAGTLQKRGPNKGKEWMFSAKFRTAREAFDWWLSDASLPKGEDDTCMGLW